MADHRGNKRRGTSFHNTGPGGQGPKPATTDMGKVKTTGVGKGKKI